MRKRSVARVVIVHVLVLSFLSLAGEVRLAEAGQPRRFTYPARLSCLSPAAFIENTGRINDPAVRYAFHGSGANVFHTTSGPVFQVFRLRKNTPPAHSYTFRATFPGAKNVWPVGRDPRKARVNYYITGERNKWHRSVPTYATVVYYELFEGIDLHTFGHRTHLKYEFHVAPAADCNRIIIKYHGISGLRVDSAGALRVSTPAGELVDA
ncbi:MAG: hypothetical protein HQ592_09245, partial [Planctomycetes bacterium]|nr:hypothetical protein [Planctomycetota bacterium]